MPHKLKIVSIGHTLVSLHPKVDMSMTNVEKAIAFQHKKTALASTNLDQHGHILTLANRLNLMLTDKSSLADWEHKLSYN